MKAAVLYEPRQPPGHCRPATRRAPVRCAWLRHVALGSTVCHNKTRPAGRNSRRQGQPVKDAIQEYCHAAGSCRAPL
jgi:hypothetical protein